MNDATERHGDAVNPCPQCRGPRATLTSDCAACGWTLGHSEQQVLQELTRPRRPPRTLRHWVTKSISVVLWISLATYAFILLGGLSLVASMFGRIGILIALAGGVVFVAINWVLPLGALVLSLLTVTRKPADQINARWMYCTSTLSVTPLLVAIALIGYTFIRSSAGPDVADDGFIGSDSVATELDSSSSTAGQFHDAVNGGLGDESPIDTLRDDDWRPRVTLRLLRRDTWNESYRLEQDTNIRPASYSTRGGNETTFKFQSAETSYSGTLKLVAPGQLEVNLEMTNDSDVWFHLDGMTSVVAEMDGESKSLEVPLAIGQHSIRLAGPASAPFETVQISDAEMLSLDQIREQWTEYTSRRNLHAALGRHGEAGFSTLLDLYRQSEPNEHELDAFFDGGGADLLEPVIAASHSQQVEQRRLATLVLSKAGPRTADGQESLLLERAIALLDDDDPYVRLYALNIMSNLALQREAAQAVDDIAALMEDEVGRVAAAVAIARFGDTALPYIRQAAVSEDPDTRHAACLALGRMREVPASEADLMRKLVHDDEPHVRRQVMYAIGLLKDRDAAIASVRHVLHDPDLEALRAAVGAVPRLDADAEQFVQRLGELLDHTDLRIQLAAAESLWEVDNDATRVLPVVQAIARDDNGLSTGSLGFHQIVEGRRVYRENPYPLARKATRLMGEIGPAAIPGLIQLLQQQPDAYAALEALGEIGPAACDAIPAIKQWAETRPQSQWYNVYRVMRKIDSAAAVEYRAANRRR